MTTSPRLGFTELAAGQAVPETTVNEENRYLEQGASHFIVKDKDLATPPGSPADGDCYIVASSPTGAWSGKAKSLAFYLNTAWAFVTPIEGTKAYVQDEDTTYVYSGSTWGADTSASAAESTDSQVWTGSDTATRLTPRRLKTASAPQTLTDGATINWDISQGFNAKVTLGGNRTFAAPTNSHVGQSYALEVIQDGTGSRTLTWNTAFDWGSAGTPTLSTGASKRDLVFLYCYDDSTPKFRATFNKSA